MAVNTIAHYRLSGLLGRGGMAEVYQAVDTKKQQNVALKILLPHLAAEDVIRHRFLREAKVGMELDHLGIVKVFDVGETQERPYMAMELVKGNTLEDLLKTKTFDLEQCIGIALKITDALAAAHLKKIVHRDIKPRNIMITDKGIKIMDFGLARILETSSITDQHEIIGTLYYMSPEQAIGIKVDESSDVFSLGVVLYQMLTGQLPFAGEHPGAIIHAILYSDPLRIHGLGKAIPLELEQIVFKTLKKKSQLRYRTAGELHTDLSKMHYVLQGQPIQLLATEEVFEESPRGIYSKLIGREKEMAGLEAALEKMMKGESSVILVSGEAGIGKSRLVWELGRKAKDKQARYLLGRCLFGERGYPYQPVIDVLRNYFKLKGIKDQDAVDAFVKEKASHLTARKGIVYSLLVLQPGQPITLINKEQLWDTISELLKTIAQDRPVVLHFDDVHWADAPTLNLLTYLAMTTRNDRLMIIGTYRPEELVAEEGKHHPLETMLQLLSKENLYQEFKLGRLDKQGTHDVVNSVFAEASFPGNFYNSVHQETEGNPLFVLEVLKYLQNERIVDKDATGWHLTNQLTKLAIPDRVTDVITHRLTKLLPENRALLDVAAVEGYTFQSDTLCNVLEESRLQVLRRLQHLESQHHLIHALEYEYQFDHGKIQETIYNALAPELKKEYHKLIAEHLIKNFGEKDEYSGKIANHLIEGGREQESIVFISKAGQYAQKLYANEKALEYYETGLRLAEKYLISHPDATILRAKLPLLKGRAEMKELLMQYDEALDMYEQTRALALEIGDDKSFSEALNKIGITHAKRGNYERSVHYFEQALRTSKRIGDLQHVAYVLKNIGIVHRTHRKHTEALEYFRQALKIRRQIGETWRDGNLLHSIGATYEGMGNYKKALTYFEYALKVQRLVGDKHGEAAALVSIGNVSHTQGDCTEALSKFEQAAMIYKLIGDRRGHLHAICNTGSIYAILGQYSKALNYYEQVLSDSYAAQFAGFIDGVAVNAGIFNLEIGNYEKALSYLMRAVKTSQQTDNKQYLWAAQQNIVRYWLELGDYRKATLWFRKNAQIPTSYKPGAADCVSYIDGGLIKYFKKSYTEAYSDIKKGLRMAQATKEFSQVLEGLQYAARVEIAQEHFGNALKHLGKALTLAEQTKSIHDIAMAHLLSGRTHFMTGDLCRTKYHCGMAVKTAENCGLKEILWQAHHLLAKVYIKEKKHNQLKDEMAKAKEVLDVIINSLSDELKKIYLKRKEMQEFQKDSSSTKRKSKRGKTK